MSGKWIPDHLQIWVETRKRLHLSHAQVQMARELSLNPKKLWKLANEDQEPWKIPLPQFIECLYRKRFRRDYPAQVMSIEERVKMNHQKKLAKKGRKQGGNEQPNTGRIPLARKEEG